MTLFIRADSPYPRTWQILPGGARGYLLPKLATSTRKTWVVIAPDDVTARACLADMECFNHLSEARLIYLPDNEVLPYDPEPAATSVVRNRAAALEAIHHWGEEPAILVTTAAAITRRLAGPEHWVESAIRIQVGDTVDRETLASKLDALGYRGSPRVRYPGDYTNHPQTLDIYTTGSAGPLRLRFRGTTVESIDKFAPDSQRATGEILTSLTCLPAREVPIDPAAAERLVTRWRRTFGSALTDDVYLKLVEDLSVAPLEAYLPLLAEKTVTLFDWLPEGAGIYLLPGALGSAKDFIARASRRFEELQGDDAYRLIEPHELWLTPAQISQELERRSLISEDEGGESLGFATTGMTRQATLDDALAALTPWFDRSKRLLLCVQTEGRAEGMSLIAEMLGRPASRVESGAAFLSSTVPVGIVQADVDQGFHSDVLGITMLTEAEIFGQAIVQRAEDTVTVTAAEVMTDFSVLEPGDPLVHARYGVGRFEGVETLDYGRPELTLVMSYAERSKIFVKMEDLDLVMRYHSVDADEAPLDRVGDARWLTGLNDALRHAESTARALLALYAVRAARSGLVCDPPGYAYDKFCRAFPYQETRDQKAAVADVIADLTSERPMDRVVSGDVGFGKTEVAMRATFLAAYSGYQVAVMVPTTLLAQQHYETFTRRFADFSFRIELLTRSSQDSSIIRGIQDGSVDIVIGTQRLLQDDAALPRLGLLIIDEEHRFGVKDKERLARLREKANVLSLTATPIPRTLSMALHGVRDISIIATPPAKRLSIRTIVADPEPDLMREAIEREVYRGGQVFYVHNMIKTIAEKAEEIRALVPDARVAYAHGRMNDLELEAMMSRFQAREFDVLVCTTIIEIGIDIPNANTILIEDADQFGLAQLHQLRGRVGRAQRQAYCYLLKSELAASERSQRRLLAMERTTGLGEGLVLAHHDLEIRGAGELLGEAQAGDIQTIGFQLYLRLLERATEAARAGNDEATLPPLSESIFELPIHGTLPESYIENPAIRLAILSRLARVETSEDVDAIEEELADRFGPLPETVQQLLVMAKIRFPLQHAGVEKMRPIINQGYRLKLASGAKRLQEALWRLAELDPDFCSAQDPLTFDLRLPDATPQDLIAKSEHLLAVGAPVAI